MFNIPMGSLLSAMANTDGERAALSLPAVLVP